eukprot:TRINITY_DN3219_c2_g5_i1.p1 TRINITY_DN3219_c2_g5~~TRINITY_DN3219_c2_g5_i1.p1  ORF type:complete len:681 (-),score=187.17 TRINITY_DN3219_c2_g5_i1:142-2184(-)
MSADVVMRDANDDDDSAESLALRTRAWAPESVDLLRKLLTNVASNPAEAKFRKLKLSNARIGALVAEEGARRLFEALGWTAADAGEALELPMEANVEATSALLKAIAPVSPGETLAMTVLRGALKSKLELPSTTTFGGLSAALESREDLGRIPRARQRLLVGYPPRPLPECHPRFATMTIGDMGLKAFKLEDSWEEMVGDLRAVRAGFAQLAPVLACKKTLFDNREFLLESARAILKARASSLDVAELKAARRCFGALWPPSEAATREARISFCGECTRLAVPKASEEGQPTHFLLEVERTDLFATAVTPAGQASVSELQRSLDVRFKGEAAEDAGGPRREFFNDFGRACADAQGVWRLTPAGALTPASYQAANSPVYRSCGRIFGLALCQAENAAQEQRVRENATLAELLTTVMDTDEEPKYQQQKLLLGLPLSQPFLRVLQGDTPESVEDLQALLNAEQSESAPDFRGSASFLKSSLRDLGLEGTLTFSVSSADGNVTDLVPGGRDKVVTDATKLAWLKAVLRHELVDSISAAAESFRQGVLEVAGAAHLALLSAEELRTEWSGLAEVRDDDLRLWQKNTEINPARKQETAWFFELLWSEELRSARPQVLKFTTGSDRWSADPKGFRFCVEPMDGGDECLPRAMTCGNMLQLPKYSNKDVLRNQLLKACEMGVSMQLV